MAKLQASGETSLTFDARSSDEDAAGSRMAFGALQRGWTLGTYRTKQPAKAKPTVAGFSVIGCDD